MENHIQIKENEYLVIDEVDEKLPYLIMPEYKLEVKRKSPQKPIFKRCIICNELFKSLVNDTNHKYCSRKCCNISKEGIDPFKDWKERNKVINDEFNVM